MKDTNKSKKSNTNKKQSILKGVKTISAFMHDIQYLSKKKALNSYAKACFSNDIS